MTLLAASAVLGLGGWLFASAAAKAVSPRAANAALRALGVANRPARVAAVLATAGEAAAAASIVLWPAARAAQLACLSLFGLFAVTGALALRTGRAIECGCMGALRRSTLGWAQIVQFGIVALALGLVRTHGSPWSPGSGATLLFALVVTTGFVLLAFAAPPWWRTRRARVSLASVAPYMHYADVPEAAAGEART